MIQFALSLVDFRLFFSFSFVVVLLTSILLIFNFSLVRMTGHNNPISNQGPKAIACPTPPTMRVVEGLQRIVDVLHTTGGDVGTQTEVKVMMSIIAVEGGEVRL